MCVYACSTLFSLLQIFIYEVYYFVMVIIIVSLGDM